MADINLLIPLLFRWEGGYVNDPDDRGGPTNRGVTLSVWQTHGIDINGDGRIDETDLKQMTQEEAVERILRPHYWNRWQADQIRSQAIANLLVGWVWGSGKYGIVIPQGILGVKQDSIVGNKTLSAVNNYPDQEELFYKFRNGKRDYLNRICLNHPPNKKFLKGWLNRLNDYKWFPVLLLSLLLGLSSCRSSKVRENRQAEFSLTQTLDSASSEKTERKSVWRDVFSTLSLTEVSGQLDVVKRKYDLSLAPDSLTGNYPVSEEIFIRRTDSKKSLSLLTDTLSLMENKHSYRESNKDSREIIGLKEKEKKEQESSPNYGYGVIGIIVVVVVLRLLRRYKE